MDSILYIGGVGSSTRQISGITGALEAYYGMSVVGMSFSDAIKNPLLVARLADNSLVITHSAGVLALQSAAPRGLIAFAPPMPTRIPLLLVRTAAKTISLFKSSKESDGRWQKILSYHMHALVEHVLGPYYNTGRLAEISKFDSALFAVTLANRGSRVVIGLMENDVLFPQSTEHPHIQTAKNHGVIIREGLLGHHDEFLLYPFDVLTQLNYHE